MYLPPMFNIKISAFFPHNVQRYVQSLQHVVNKTRNDRVTVVAAEKQ